MSSINTNEMEYLNLLRRVRNKGNDRQDRTGTGTRSIFGAQTRYDLRKGFPLLTTKKMHLPSVSSELIWFLEGSTDERRLAEIRYGRDRNDLSNLKTIWTDNVEAEYWTKRGLKTSPGDLGRVYGAQWRDWTSALTSTYSNDFETISVDQITRLVEGLKSNPYDRRHIVSAWNPGEMFQMALPPCHVLFQCYVHDDMLSLHWYQRSVDKFLGEPYNIASYGLLTHMLAQVCGYEAAELIHTQSDSHVYMTHFDAVDEQLTREPFASPKLIIDPSIKRIEDFRVDSFSLENYHAHPAIPAPMAV